jgi:hypothetical protein
MPIGVKMMTKRKHTKLTNDAYKVLVASANDLTPSPWALDGVRYSSAEGKKQLDLCFPEFSVGVPLFAIHELSNATVKDLQNLELTPARDTIISRNLDVHISVEGLLKDLAGEVPLFSKMVSSIFATHGGKRSTDKKRLSSAANGRKGGRPRKAEEPELA